MNYFKQIIVFLTLSAAALTGAELDNGFQYFNQHKESDKIDVELKLHVGQFNEKENESGIARFLACTTLQETENYTLEEISAYFQETGQDLLGRTHVRNTPSATFLCFSVSDKKELDATLGLISEFVARATLSPLALELARSELLETVEDFDAKEINAIIEKVRLSIDSHTPQQLRQRYAEWYRPDLMSLTISGDVDEKTAETLVGKHFSHLSTTDQPSPYHCSIALHEAHTTPEVNRESAHPKSSDDTVVVQGKIFMKPPSFFSTRTFGFFLASALIVAGLAVTAVFGALLIASGAGAPFGIPMQAGVAAGLITLFIGSGTMILPNYYNDPAVIEEKRIEDQKYGFHYAYAHGRAHLTLTPFERRNLFIRENATSANRYPRKFSEFCITRLADHYNLDDQVFVDMLYPHEIGDLKRIKDDFVLRRNNVSLSKKLLEQELTALVSSHQTIRDMSLEKAREEYESSPPVVKWREIKAEWEQVIDGIWADFDHGIIDEKTREEYLKERSEFYEAWLNSPRLVEDINAAKQRLEESQKLAVATYEASVQQCKLLIHYDDRMAEIEHGKWALYSYYNQVLIDNVSNMVPGDPNFVDFIDLR